MAVTTNVAAGLACCADDIALSHTIYLCNSEFTTLSLIIILVRSVNSMTVSIIRLIVIAVTTVGHVQD